MREAWEAPACGARTGRHSAPHGRRAAVDPCKEESMTSQSDRSASTTLPPPLLNIEEAAAYLNVPYRWVADALRQRRIRCTRIGKHVRFRIEHLDELVAAGEQPVTAPTEVGILSLRTRV